MKKRTRGKVIAYIFLIVVGIVMVYPLVWLFFSCFKTNQELFASLTFLPEHFSLDGFINGWKGSGQFTYGTFYRNTFLQVIPTVVFTVISTGIVAYGFARFRFPLKKAFFLMN